MCTGSSIGQVAGNAQKAVSTASTSSPTFAGKLSTGLSMASAFTKPLANAAFGRSMPTAFDPDLEQAWKGTLTGNGARVPSIAYGKRKEIQAEQQRRTDLRGAYKQLAETRSAEQTRVAEAQKQAQVQQQEETQRQVQVQEQAEADRIAQEQQVARERMATQAASQSMQVLGKAGATTTAPTAQTTRGSKGAARVRATSGTQGLRIGSSVAATGAGLNIGA